MAEAGRSRLSPNGAAALVLVVLAVGLLLWQRPWASDPSRTPDAALPSDAAAVLTDQARALSEARTENELVAAAGSGEAAQRFARAVWSARERLDVGAVRWRYVSGGDTVAFDDGDARARFDVDGAGGSVGVQLRVHPRDDGGLDVVGVVGADDPLPLWLAGALDVEIDDGRTVVSVDGGAGDDRFDVAALARTAREQVSRLTGSDRPLVVVAAPSAQVAALLLGRPVDELSQVAAVSTRLDERHGSLRGPAVVLNPEVFATMDARAAQIVMTHEATHVMTDGIGSRGSTWVVEGYADFVALHDDTAPLEISAGQALAEVARSGAPRALPSDADFDTSSHGIGGVYESAWLVFRMLAENHGDAAVTRFYDDVVGGTDVERASRSAFGTSIDEVTRQWRRYLQRLARGLDAG